MKENKYLEYKQEVNDKFLKTVSAFSNYGEGTIIFGIDDNGKYIGLKDIDNLCLKIENKINDSIKPKPEFEINVNKQTIVLKIHKGFYTPYTYKGKAYKRNDTSTIEVDELEFDRLKLEGMHMYYEELRSNKKNLSFNYLEKAFNDILGIKKLNKDILKTLNLFSEQNVYNKAAEILSDQNGFPGIDIARFGDSINIILDRELIEKQSILSMFDKAIDIFERYYSYEEIKSVQRQKQYLIPLEAYREAVANALIHRTYDDTPKIRIAMFSDKIEVYSPGGLPSGVSEDDYLNGQVSKLRNPIIANVFFRLKIIEMFGTGITRIKNAYKDIDNKPKFEIFDNSIKITLPTINKNISLSKDEEKVYEMFDNNHLLASSDIVKESGFGKDKVLGIVDVLCENDLIYSVGSGRGRKYKKH